VKKKTRFNPDVGNVMNSLKSPSRVVNPKKLKSQNTPKNEAIERRIMAMEPMVWENDPVRIVILHSITIAQ